MYCSDSFILPRNNFNDSYSMSRPTISGTPVSESIRQFSASGSSLCYFCEYATSLMAPGYRASSSCQKESSGSYFDLSNSTENHEISDRVSPACGI